jgi:hypothetical protein
MNEGAEPGRHRALRPLAIDLDDLIVALTWRDEFLGGSHWLDVETGEVVFVGGEDDIGDLAEDPRDNERFVRVDAIDSPEAFRIMEQFVEQLADTPVNMRLARQLAVALEQRKPFRRFKDALAEVPAQREAWFAFERTALELIARAWCEGFGIAPQWRTQHAKPGGHMT